MKSPMPAACTLALLALQALPAKEPDWRDLEQQFDTLPMAARRLTGPLFWMHGDETRAQLEAELQKVLEGHNGTFTAEPRPHQDWLGEGWYRDLGINLDFARKHDLTMFIYDDWWWPSQMMGGRVPPEYGSKRLVATELRVEGPKTLSETGYADPNLIKVIAGREIEGGVDATQLVDLTDSVRDGTLRWKAPAGTWRIMKFTWKFNGTQGGQQKFVSVDGADPACVDWFIKAVYQPHHDRFKSDFGKTITGYFYDEPETQGDWGSDFPKLLAERKLDLNKLLVAYKFKLAGADQTAALYTYLDCFAESWGRTMYGGMSRWCREHQVVSMGHFMEHGNDMFSRDMSGGNMMQLLKYSDMGGMDLVCGQLQPGNRNLGEYQMPKMASSVSHTYNKDQDLAFCEIFGGYNQTLTYPTMKWLTDWHQVRGVNFLIPHSFNPRAPYDGDYPPYFYNGGKEPRWPLYRVWADYTNRLSLLLTGGRHVAPVAMLHLGQSYHVGAKQRPEELTSTLQDAQFDCDWLLYDAWENNATLEANTIRLHKESYQVLVMPAAEVIPYPALAKAREFFNQGGVVLAYGMLPSKSATLGRDAKDITTLRDALWGTATPGLAVCKTSAAGGRSYFLPAQPSPADLQKVLAADAGIHPALEVWSGDTGNWLHVLHRQKAGRDVFLVCNQNHAGAARPFTFRTAVKGSPEIWDPMRNEITSIPCKRDGQNTEFSLTLEPSESVLVVFQDQQRKLPGRITADLKPQREIPLRDTRPVADQSSPAKLVVVKATYGVPGDAQRSRDVRQRLQQCIDDGERLLPVLRMADGDDPAVGVVKILEAECTAGDRRITLKGDDTQTVILSANPTALEQEIRRNAAGRHFNASPAVAHPFAGSCEIPADLDLTTVRVCLEVDELTPEAAASVNVNGAFAGGFIGKPLRLDVTRLLKPGPNTILLEPFTPKSARLVVY
ncbi:MAG: glycosyl hydrolase [Verrucomicrobia bacterium]|nr:glycosyl hydrolase [Verrucomicrobiota bacterium]